MCISQPSLVCYCWSLLCSVKVNRGDSAGLTHIYLFPVKSFLVKYSYLDNLSNILTSFWASYSFCSSVISSMGFGIGSSTWPVIGLMLEQAAEQAQCTAANGFVHYQSIHMCWTCWHGRARTRALQICIPPCLSPHLRSTESLLSLQPEVLEPPGVLQHFHTLCTSTGCLLQDDTTDKLSSKWAVL